MTFPRRNQYRHTLRAACQLIRAGLAFAAGLGCLACASAASRDLPETALLAVCGCVLLALGCSRLRRASRETQIAQRNRVGADSEDLISARLRLLCSEGWSLRRSLDWPGRGDIDNAMRTPGGGLAIVVESKTRGFLREHLCRTRSQASWLCREYGCPRGAVAVVALARRRGVERLENGVLVVSVDLLLDALRAADRASLARQAPSAQVARQSSTTSTPVRHEPRAERAAASPGAGAVTRRAPDAMLAPIARHLAEHRHLLAAEDELARILGQLDPERWRFERGLRIDGMSMFLLLGANGAFLLAASRGHWTMEQIDALQGAAGAVAAAIPGYPSQIRVIIALVGIETQPRRWCTTHGACAWVLGAGGLARDLANFHDHGFSPADLRRLQALSGEQPDSRPARGFLPAGRG